MNDQEKREKNKALLREQYERLMEIAVAGRCEIEKFFTDDVVMELPFLNVKSVGLDNMIGAVQSVAQNFERYGLRSMTFYDCTDPDTLAGALARPTGVVLERGAGNNSNCAHQGGDDRRAKGHSGLVQDICSTLNPLIAHWFRTASTLA